MLASLPATPDSQISRFVRLPTYAIAAHPGSGVCPQVRLADVDPDLFARLDPRFDRARDSRLVAPIATIKRGPWTCTPDASVLVLDGLLLRTITIAGRASHELLGAGDFIAADEPDPLAPMPVVSSWRALDETTVAIVDDALHASLGQFPTVSAALTARVDRRVRELAIRLALVGGRSLEDQLLGLLWHFAGRWGQQTANGVVLSLALTHSMLANLLSAQRPSVSTALGRLAASGSLEALGRGSWRLHHPPG